MLKLANRVKETSVTTGTGTYNLDGPVAGFQSFVAGIGSGNTCYYVAENDVDWEVGIGTVTDAAPDTLARTAILASSNSNAAVNWGVGTKDLFVLIPAEGRMPRGHLWDLTMSNAADTVNDITVQPGQARDEDDNVDMGLASAITKQLDVAWAVGNNAGGLNTGVKAASTWYEVHLIKRLDTGVVDVMFTTTANRATLPANYTRQRRIGWIRTDSGSGILQFSQKGNYFTLITQINDVSATVTTTATAVILTVPPDCIARFRANTLSNTNVNAAGVIVFSEIIEGAVTPATTTGIASLGLWDFAAAEAGHFELQVDSSSQIEHDASLSTGSPTFDISTFGWVDRRGREFGT